MRRQITFVLLAVCCVVLLGSISPAQSVLYKARIGNYTEGIAYVSNGTYANYIAVTDGFDVLGMPVAGKGKNSAQKLFDTFDLAISRNFVGMAYVPTEKLFVFTDSGQPDQLIFANQKGKSAGNRKLIFPADDPFRPNRYEGIVYLPKESSSYPDHLVAISFCQAGLAIACVGGENEMRLLVIERSGVVVKEIIPNFPDEFYNMVGEVLGIGFQAPNVLLGSAGPYIWKMDFNGNMLGQMAYTGTDGDSTEGVAQLADGRIVSSSGFGKLRFFDAALNRMPAYDRDYTLGLGISSATGIAWNPDTKQLLITEQENGKAVWSVPSALKSKNKVIDLSMVQLGGLAMWPEPDYLENFRFRVMSYLPDQHQIALTALNAAVWSSPPEDPNRFKIPARVRVVRFDNSGMVVGYERLFDWDPRVYPNMQLWTWDLSYMPASDNYGAPEYVLRSMNSSMLHLVRPVDGISDNTIDLSQLGLPGIAIAEYYKPANSNQGQFLVIGNDYNAVVTDRYGRKLSAFNLLDKLHVRGFRDLAYITSGTYKGAFAGVTMYNCELVIFKVK